MPSITVRSSSQPGAGGGTGASGVQSLSALGRQPVRLEQLRYATDWRLVLGADSDVQHPESVEDVVEGLRMILEAANVSGLHVAYHSRNAPLHEFWPASSLPIISVQ